MFSVIRPSSGTAKSVDSQQSRRLSAEARQVCAQKNKNCRYAPTSFCDSQHRPALGPIRLETVSRHMPSHASSILSSVLLCAFVFKNPSLSDFHAGQALVSQKSLRVALARFFAICLCKVTATASLGAGASDQTWHLPAGVEPDSMVKKSSGRGDFFASAFWISWQRTGLSRIVQIGMKTAHQNGGHDSRNRSIAAQRISHDATPQKRPVHGPCKSRICEGLAEICLACVLCGCLARDLR